MNRTVVKGLLLGLQYPGAPPSPVTTTTTTSRSYTSESISHLKTYATTCRANVYVSVRIEPSQRNAVSTSFFCPNNNIQGLLIMRLYYWDKWLSPTVILDYQPNFKSSRYSSMISSSADQLLSQHFVLGLSTQVRHT